MHNNKFYKFWFFLVGHGTTKRNGRDHRKELFETVLSEKVHMNMAYIPKSCVQPAEQSYIG